ncbi:BamA/TamA family outer membrane protein [Sphingobium naphthae]|uniref:BamA/TamA family outer membrane protein n=1 Tax=Sphingobium naphthae TaxID=1886786 RepID=A0ABU3ZSF9_9SPHN|nr:BamA/TamA family outer membrane protein [Sphingobium naphthae]MDV5822385.1 BamA/TamA family outer membrane protein [Sphingobium naphthae]
MPGASQPMDPAQPATPVETESKFHRTFFDETDGKLDFSNFLAKGGFFPMPVIITEPAVDGGFGIVGQFITMSKDDPKRTTRRMLGAVKTGNGSYGYGYFQSGSAFDGKVSYKFGVGRGKITLKAYPDILPSGLEYTNKYEYGALASVRLHLADPRFSLGPLLDFRKLRSSIDLNVEDLPDRFSDFDRKLQTGALGFGVHFDSRDNALTPTKGYNIYAEGKFNDGAFGSDRDFQIYDVHGYGFHPLSSKWRLGAKVEVDAIRGDYPVYFASSVNLRGVEARRYQGETAVSTELEVTRQVSPRWALLGFAGLGFTDAGGARLFEDSGAKIAGGVGFRYRIARKLGLDAGVDVAYGPSGAVFYLQFGHAWAFNLD